MIKLFKYEGFKVSVEPEALMLKPFKDVYAADKSRTKANALNDFAFIYFYADPRSDYSYLTNDEERADTIKRDLGFPKTWKITPKLQAAIDFYSSFKSTGMLLLEDIRVALSNTRDFVRNVNLNEVDDNGKLIHSINTFTSSIKQLISLAEEIDKTEKKIIDELSRNESRVTGGKDKTLFEDGFLK